MAYAATIVSIYSLLGIFGKLILGSLSDKLGIIKSGSIGYIAISIAFILLLFGQSKSILIDYDRFLCTWKCRCKCFQFLYLQVIYLVLRIAGVMMGITNSAFQVGMALGGFYDCSSI